MQEDKPSPNYDIFHQWFNKHGGRASKINFPTKFGPTQYIGISAKQHIKANQVILAIPKKLIISVSMVRNSPIGKICEKYRILNDIDNQETDFHILTLYLIWQKQLGQNSFFYPYLQCIEIAETILDWDDKDIEKMKEPTITDAYLEYIKKDFPQVFHVFVEISVENTALFNQVITWQTFMGCYSIVMTRCFGWGLPETMLVPFADFMNHNCSGVNHYTFNKKLEYSDHQDYVKKLQQLDLSILGINNELQLPTTYARNKRQAFVYAHKQILKQKKIFYDQNIRLNSNQTRQQLNHIQNQILLKQFDIHIFPSSDSQDNDSEPDDLCGEGYQEHVFVQHINKLVKKQIEPQFQQPKPYVNRQFLDGVSFEWWNEVEDEDSYFIVAASSAIKKYDQIFNSYGRRSNRFLLVWYGFTIFNNKYDSIPFRLLSEQIYSKIGKYVYVQHLVAPYFNMGNQKYGYQSLSQEYRLKKKRINYKLMTILRRRIVRSSQLYKDLYIKKLLTIHDIKNLQIEKKMLQLYQTVLKHLFIIFDPYTQRQRLSQSHRDYFANLLLKSNKQILEAHRRSIQILKNVIANLQKGMSVLQAYKYEYTDQDEDCLLKVESRKMLIDYFKMLKKWQYRNKSK